MKTKKQYRECIKTFKDININQNRIVTANENRINRSKQWCDRET